MKDVYVPLQVRCACCVMLWLNIFFAKDKLVVLTPVLVDEDLCATIDDGESLSVPPSRHVFICSMISALPVTFVREYEVLWLRALH